MMRLLKAIWNFLTHKANSAAKALDSLVTAEDKLNKVKADLEKKLDKQKRDAIELFATQEKFKDTLADSQKKCEDLKVRAKTMKAEGAAKNKIELVAQEYLAQKSLVDELKSNEKLINAKVKIVEENLQKLNYNKASIESRATILETKIKLYRSLKDVDDLKIAEIKNAYAEVEKAIDEVKYNMEAEQKAEEIIHTSDPVEEEAYTSADVENFINSL